jgi:hypothetical protein
MREFIIGPTTTNSILQGIKSEEARRNDRMWLYQHTARCPVAVQLFLDANPDFWCLVPMTKEEAAARVNTTIPPSYRRAPIRSTESRSEADAKYLSESVPHPPPSFAFTDRQKHGQVRFFRELKDQVASPTLDTNVNLYNAAIVAVCKYLYRYHLSSAHDSLCLVPDNCSAMLRNLVLSLFITHADCNLNKTGRLVNENIYHEYPVRGYWCADLVRRPLSSLF